MVPYRILIADDHQIFIDGLTLILKQYDEIEVIDSACDGREALEKIAVLDPDMVIMDMKMPKVTGFEAIKTLRERDHEIKIMILTMSDDRETIEKILALGANAFLLKNSGVDELLAAIDVVRKHGTYISPEIGAIMVAEILNCLDDAPWELSGQIRTSSDKFITKREMQIINLIVDGFTTNQIAEKLFISATTVKTHRNNILSKLSLNNSASLVKYALKKRDSNQTKNTKELKKVL